MRERKKEEKDRKKALFLPSEWQTNVPVQKNIAYEKMNCVDCIPRVDR